MMLTWEVWPAGTSKKYLIEQKDGEKIVSRKQGVTTLTCLRTAPLVGDKNFPSDQFQTCIKVGPCDCLPSELRLLSCNSGSTAHVSPSANQTTAMHASHAGGGGAGGAGMRKLLPAGLRHRHRPVH